VLIDTVDPCRLVFDKSTDRFRIGILSAASSGISPNPTVNVQDTTTGNQLYMVPNAGSGSFVPTTRPNDAIIIGRSTLGVANTPPINICVDSATSHGIRITPTTTTIGAGGTSAIPTNNATFTSTGAVFSGLGVTVNTNTTSIRNISEKIAAPTSTPSPYVCDYSNGSVFFLPATVTNGTFSVRFINVPSITSTTQNYVMAISYVASSTANYCNTVTLSTTSTPSASAATLKYNSGVSSVPVIAVGNNVLQQFVVTYFASATVVLTTISVFG
jgi:hypothetical protein